MQKSAEAGVDGGEEKEEEEEGGKRPFGDVESDTTRKALIVIERDSCGGSKIR